MLPEPRVAVTRAVACERWLRGEAFRKRADRKATAVRSQWSRRPRDPIARASTGSDSAHRGPDSRTVLDPFRGARRLPGSRQPSDGREGGGESPDLRATSADNLSREGRVHALNATEASPPNANRDSDCRAADCADRQDCPEQ
jgi:hypothetical protein